MIYDSGFSTPISLKTHADLMRPLFVSSVTPLTAEEMTAIFHIDYSLPGSSRQQLEEATILHWTEFLNDLENGLIGKSSKLIIVYSL